MSDLHALRRLVIENDFAESESSPDMGLEAKINKYRRIIDESSKVMLAAIARYNQEIPNDDEHTFNDIGYIIEDIVSELDKYR